MTAYELKSMVGRWVAYQYDPKNDDKWQAWAATREHLDYLIDYEPWDAWAVITAIHDRDKSNTVNQSLCAGPVENLLVQHGYLLIESMATYARKNPTFATLLKGIWRGAMTDEVWAHVQAIRERRAFQGFADLPS